MGHIRLGSLPRYRKWQQVIALIEEGASVSELASATLAAAERGLAGASKDRGLVYSFWLITQVPQAARQAEFVSGLRKLGISVADQTSLQDLTGGFSEAVDQHLVERGGRSDLGEMAQLSALESLTKLCASRLGGLFGVMPEDLRKALRDCSTSKGFSQLCREFFSRLTYRYLAYFLSRELSNHVGRSKRFFNIGDHSEFSNALELHSHQATRIIEEFAGGWYSKANYEGGITEDKAAGFVYAALKKIKAELKRGGEANEE